MRYKIRTEAVLFNYLFYNPNASLDILTLGKIEENIFKFKNLETPLYVAFTNDFIVGAVEYSSFFQWDPNNTDNIIRNKRANESYYNEKNLKAFNYGLPQDVISAIEKACKENY